MCRQSFETLEQRRLMSVSAEVHGDTLIIHMSGDESVLVLASNREGERGIRVVGGGSQFLIEPDEAGNMPSDILIVGGGGNDSVHYASWGDIDLTFVGGGGDDHLTAVVQEGEGSVLTFIGAGGSDSAVVVSDGSTLRFNATGVENVFVG